MINLKKNHCSHILTALAVVSFSTSTAQADTPKPSYPSAVTVTINSTDTNSFYRKINQAVNSSANTVYIKFTTAGPIKLNKPLNLSVSKRYVFYKQKGTPKVVIDGDLKTPFLATNNGTKNNPETYTRNPRNLRIDLFNMKFIKCRNFKGRNSGDGRGSQKWSGGGAIALNASTLRIIDCDFINNQAQWPSTERGVFGCSELVGGGAVRMSSGTLLAWNSRFINNKALTGGGIHVRHSDCELYDCKINSNQALGGMDGFVSGSIDWNSSGGGFRCDSTKPNVGKTHLYRNNIFRYNSATSFISKNVDVAPAKKFNADRGRRVPNVAQSANALNLYTKKQVGNNSTRSFVVTGGRFEGNRNGHIAVIRLSDQAISNPAVVKNVTFFRNGRSDNKNYRTNSLGLRANPANVKTQAILSVKNGSASQVTSPNTIPTTGGNANVAVKTIVAQ